MKRINLTLLLLVITVLITSAQDKYLEKGNYYLDNGQFDKAELTFIEAIKSDSTNLVYQCQLGLTLIQAERYSEADKILTKVLKADSNNVAAIWYIGICYYSSLQVRKAVSKFEKALVLLDKNSGQYYSAYWFIGKIYSMLLKTEGLTYIETDRMFECFEEYLKLQPNAEDSKDIREYVDRKKKRRPSNNVEIWIDL